MTFSEKQKIVIRTWNREQPITTILEGAVRSGKTFVGLVLWMRHVFAFRGDHRDFIITGNTIGSLERNVLKPLTDMFGIDARTNQFNQFKMFGNTINCFGTDKENSYEAMTGFTAYGWYGNEITLSHNNSINEAFDRCSGEGFKIFWDTNPDYPEHPIKIDHIDKSGERLDSGRLRLYAEHFEIDDNPFLSPDYVENLKKSTPPGMWYNRKIKGLWVAAEGVVYEGWNTDVHYIEPFDIPHDWVRVRMIDFGYTNPFVNLWGAVDPDGRFYIYREHYQANMLIEDHVRHINQGNDFWINKDNKKIDIPYDWTVADHDAQERAEYDAKGISTIPAQKDVLLGIQRVAERLIIRDDGKARLYVFNTCPNTKREMGKYVWEPRRDGKPVKEEPMKVDDHCLDCIRYGVMQLDNPVIPVISATLRR